MTNDKTEPDYAINRTSKTNKPEPDVLDKTRANQYHKKKEEEEKKAVRNHMGLAPGQAYILVWSSSTWTGRVKISETFYFIFFLNVSRKNIKK